jgi:hypothetical protein
MFYNLVDYSKNLDMSYLYDTINYIHNSDELWKNI